MAKKIMGSLKLQVKAQQANPSPPVGPALGQRGLNIMAFVKEFNAKSADYPAGTPVPVVITYYQDKSFSLELKTPPTSYLLKQAAGLPQVGKIAETKMKDLNANDVEAAMGVIVGTAKSCGIEIKG
jgi:large subunit ribosomal protein L11